MLVACDRRQCASRPIRLVLTTDVKGLDDILESPVLTMEQEFLRPRPPFVDWRGATHELRALWAYATGPATAAADDGAGVRDEHNAGMLPEQFRARVNEHIRARRAEFVASHGGGHTSDGSDPCLVSPPGLEPWFVHALTYDLR
jgi:hypothetical protein